MKSFVFKFWTETDTKQKKFLVLRVFPSTEDGDSPNGYLFLHQDTYNIFIENYEILRERTSPDWRNFFRIYVAGGFRLQVCGANNNVYLNLPELEYV